MRLIRRHMGGVVLLLVSIVLSLVLVEGLLRILPGLLPLEVRKQVQDDPKQRGISHPYIGHLHRPNSTGLIWGSDFKAIHHTDGHGFRNAWPWPEQAGIVVLGDSLAFGYGVEDTEVWPAILDRALPQFQVMNLGLIGAGLQQYLRVYETFGVPLHPRVLLVALFVYNDFSDTGLFDHWLKSGAGGNYMVWRDFGKGGEDGFDVLQLITSIKRIFKRNSYLYNLLRYARNAYRDWRLSEPRNFLFADGSRLQLRPSDLAEKTTGAEPERPEFRLVLQALTRIQSIAKESGTHVLVVFQPSKEEVYMPLLGEAAPDPGRPLRTALDQLGIPYLNLAPAFQRQARAGEQLFFEQDGHPNRQGYRLIACEIVAHLKAKGAAYGLHESVVGSSSEASSPSDRSSP